MWSAETRRGRWAAVAAKTWKTVAGDGGNGFIAGDLSDAVIVRIATKTLPAASVVTRSASLNAAAFAEPPSPT